MDFSNIQYQRIPMELISNKQITNLQFRILCNLLKYSLDDDHSYLGSFKMAEACNVGRAAYLRAIKELEKMGFVEIHKRGNFSRSNDILLTVSRGLAMLRSGETAGEPEVYQNDTPQVNQKNTPTVTHFDTRVYLNDTRVTHNDTPHIDDRFNKLNLNNLNTPVNHFDTPEGTQNETPRVGSKQLEPADVTAGRTMPNSGCAGSARKEGRAEGAQLDIEDYCLWQDFKLDFSGCYPWLQLVRVQNHLLIRGLGRMGEDILVKAWDEVKAWFAARGVVVEKVGQSQRFSGEIIIKEAV